MASHGVPRVSETEPRTEGNRQQERQRIKAYKDLVDLVEKKIQEHQYTLVVLGLTTKLLSKNPEYYTVWNHRRRILQQLFSPPESEKNDDSISEIISNDLEFIIPLLVEFPKCYWVWNHRLWLLQETSRHLTVTRARQFWQDELGLVSKMLSRDNRNFHGWGYRRVVVGTLDSPQLSPEGKLSSMAKEEFDYTTRMIHSNLSNFSAWHNRSKLLPRWLAESGVNDVERRKMLDEELALVQEALYLDARDQSLWFYHQALMSAFSPTLSPLSIAPNLSLMEQISYVNAETIKLVEMLDGAEECKWIYQSLLQLCIMHKELSGQLPEATTPDTLITWLDELEKLDELRKGRWVNLREEITTMLHA